MTSIGMTRNTILALAVVIGAAAQTSSANRFGIADRMEQNAEILKHYTYKRRTEIIVKGEPRGERVDLIRYVDGSKKTIPLETPERTGQSRGRGMRGKIIERKVKKKKEEMKAEMERLKNLMNGYLSTDSQAMAAILRKAEISKTGSGVATEVTLKAVGVKQPSDSFTMVWSEAGRRPVRIEIRAEAHDESVQLSVNYSSLPDETFYPAKTTISVPKKNLAVTITRSDYTRSAENTP